MRMKNLHSRWLTGAVLLAMVELVAVVAVVATTLPAQAQRRGGGFFDQLFGAPQYQYPMEERPADYSRAPAAHRSESTPTTAIVVMGDAMADWLAYGLEEAFTDSPEIGVVRKHKTYSGLLRYEPRSDLDWSRMARDILAKERADFVVMMIGLQDRTSIREAQPARSPAAAQKQGKGQPEKDQQDKNQDKSQDNSQQDKTSEQKNSTDDADQPTIIAPEPRRTPGSANEFRSDRWAELYGRKIDEMIAALKSKGVPVLWIGLPAIRGPRSTADAVYLNDLYRARAEKAGIVYVDVWDGFVDEAGKYTTQGPDLEGQTRRLRAGDGVYFTKAGARKLAHYVERELRRLMSNRAIPVALPSDLPLGPQAPDTRPGVVTRPLAGPVLPLAASPAGSDELLGGRNLRPANTDPVATRVLLKGEPVAAAPGRADDFAWPRGQPTAAEPAAASASVEPPAAAAGRASSQKNPRGQTGPTPAAKPNSAPQLRSGPRPPQPQVRRNDPRGWLR